MCVSSRFDAVSVTDNKANTYVMDFRRNFSFGSVSVWYSSNVTVGGAGFIVSVTQSAQGTPGAAAINFSAQEVSGIVYVAERNTAGVNPNGITSFFPTAGTSPGITTSKADEYQVTMFYAGTTPTGVNAGPQGWNNILLTEGGALGPVAQIIDRTTTSISVDLLPQWSLTTSRTWVALLVTFAEVQSPTGTLVTGARNTGDHGPLRSQFGTPWGFLGPPPRWPDIHLDPPPGLPFNRYLQSQVRDLLAPDRDIVRATQKLRNISNSLLRKGIIQITSDGSFAVRAGSFTATRSPEVTDDLRTIGAQVGSLWYDSENEQLWMCKDPAVSEADWARISLAEDFIGNPFSGSL